jgi:hypothetical protein
VVLVVMTAGIVGLVIENARLQADNVQAKLEAAQTRTLIRDLTAKGGHFTVARGWAGVAHVAPVKGSGADRCFECHQETQCSDCHIARK